MKRKAYYIQPVAAFEIVESETFVMFSQVRINHGSDNGGSSNEDYDLPSTPGEEVIPVEGDFYGDAKQTTFVFDIEGF